MLRVAIGHYIRLNCIPVDANFPEHAHELLVEVLAKTVERTAIKFVKGQLEHGGDLLNRNLGADILDEITDLNVYITAELIKQQTKTKK